MFSVSTITLFVVITSGIFSLYWYRRHRTNDPTQELHMQQQNSHETSQLSGETPDQARGTRPILQPWEYFLVLDVEATCVAGTDFNWPNEIIEWPVMLLAWNDRDDGGRATQLTVVDEFRSFVRPTRKPKLTDFCMSLTGITQTDVDTAPIFSTVLDNFQEFLCRHGLICSKTGRRLRKFIWATDGPCDIRDFVVKQCFISKIEMPEWLRDDVIDVRKLVAAWLGPPQQTSRHKKSRRWSPGRSLSIPRQLTALSLPPFQGREHSGIDDARNIVRILTELARRGVKLEPNLRIHPGKRWYWMGNEHGEIFEEYFP